ncbi:prephenate dehydratase [Limnobacter humi]|uniref:Bifunctional chorismate mutase/prephenate dehydratase n=1 Tax=Limnobacter humi TaxID=1778671 RepID=A0ABT1WGE1_9BURK|nr:prephenate dehydratase [Limnobacter humi]MCQ8896590.1 prephenate dehydratase [Limnobacter humi]
MGNSEKSDVDINQELLKFRDQIDALDLQILGLLNQRARLAQDIGHVKAKTDAPVMRPEREAQVLDKLTNANQGPLSAPHVRTLFKEIMSACRSLEREVHVAFLGPLGTYSEQAVWSFFGHCVQAEPVETIEEAFRQLDAEQVDFAVVPVENSTEGSVARTLDALVDSHASICGEVQLPIHHQLLTQSGSLQGIQKICAHPQALAQCRNWLAQNAPQIQQETVSSNGAAAKLASEDPTVAAIAGQTARERYSLKAVQEHIQDDANNTTRFLVLGKQQPGPSGIDKTSLVASVPNQPGAVYKMLEPMNAQNVSMTRLESRPARTGRWEYYFFIDLQGHQQDAAVARALDDLRQSASFLKVLGSYPAAQRT